MNVRLVLASGAALGAIALSSPALAQDAPASEPAAEEEGGIIVTARRQSESLQDVPAAVTVTTDPGETTDPWYLLVVWKTPVNTPDNRFFVFRFDPVAERFSGDL